MKKLKILLCFSIILIVFLRLFIYFNYDQSSKYNDNLNTVNGTIDNYYLKDDTYYIEITGTERLLVTKKDKFNAKVGDRVSFIGEFSLPSANRNFNLFNYRNYLLSKGIHYIFNSIDYTIVKENNNKIYQIRNYLNGRLSDIDNNYLSLFIMGNNKQLDPNIKDTFSKIGVSHLFSISGMHIGIFSSILLLFLGLFIHNKKINNIIVSFILIGYLLILGYNPSIFRTVLLFVTMSLFSFFGIKIKSYLIILGLFIFCIYVNPYSLYNSGFLFTYIISFMLSVLSSKLQDKNNYISKLLYISLISQLVSLPIVINSYFEVNLLSPLFNLILVPIISLIIFPLSLISFVFTDLVGILEYLLNIFENISLFFSSISIMITMKKMSLIMIIIYYIIVIILLKKTDKNYILYGAFILICFIYSNLFNLGIKPFYTMLDVGQGDASIIVLPFGQGNIMIDTGGYVGSNYTDNTLIPYLKSIGVRKLDYLIISHGDMDHMGEAISLINKFKVNEVIFNNNAVNSLEEELIKELEEKRIPYYKGLKELNLNRYKINFLNTGTYSDENDSSNVVYINMDKTKILLMGDAGVEREKDILEKYNLKNIDILKVGHHGSNTSTSEEFVKNINPKICLISVGKNNWYGHPKQNVLDRLNKCDIYRTDLDGSVEIKINKNGYKIMTCSP